MKFNEGYWYRKKGVHFYTPTEIVDVQEMDGKIIVVSSHKVVPHNGETTNAVLIYTELFSVAPDVIGVRHYHWKGGVEKAPHYELKHLETDLITKTDQHYARLQSGDTWVEVTQENGWTMKFYYKDRFLTGTTRKDMGYILVDQDPDSPYMKEQLSMGPGENIYGFGERFTNFVKNGQQIELWNLDGGTASEQAYKNIPFYVSSNKYGVFINHPELISVEAGSEVVTGTGFSVRGEKLEYHVLGGEHLKDVVSTYTEMTGKPAVPPSWSFGLWLSTSFTTDYDQAKVRQFVTEMKEKEIPLAVFHLDSFYQKPYCFCDFLWDSERFPDPEGLIREIRSGNVRVSQWINPYMGQKSPLFDECKEKGYFIKRTDGSVWQTDLWMAGTAIIDFTNPEARKWYRQKLIEKMDMGISAFKTDFGETIPAEDVVFYDGSDPRRMHNYYTYLYNRTVFEAVEDYYGKGNGLVFGRSATVGSQKYPLQWAGDSYSSYGSMAETLRGGLSLSLAGFGFWSHDMSGFEKTATPDLYKRWCAFGLLSTHSRLHGSESYRVPWLFGEESVDVLRYFVKLKCRLMPYFFAKSCEASQTGIPVLRPMVLEFDEDFCCKNLDMQYMLGDALLAAPIFKESGEVEYYVPDGLWNNILTGEKLEGGKAHYGKFDYFSLPLLLREDRILPLGRRDDTTEYDFEDGVEFHIYELEKSAECTLYSPSCKKGVSITAERLQGSLKVSVTDVQKEYSLVIHTAKDLCAFGEIFKSCDDVVRINPPLDQKEYIIEER